MDKQQPLDKDSFGYPTKEACVICGGYDNNQREPRFGYVVCEKHQPVPPVQIDARFDRMIDAK